MAIENTHNLFRHVQISVRDKANGAIPAIRCFSPSPADNYKLSVDWDKLTTAEESLARLGGTYKYGKTEFKEFQMWEVYMLNVGEVRDTSLIDDVVHDPILHEVVTRGRPNNESHSLILISQDPSNEAETFIALRNSAKKVDVAIENVVPLVKLLREIPEQAASQD